MNMNRRKYGTESEFEKYRVKMLYLAMVDVTKKWTGKSWDGGLTLDQLCIYFGDQIHAT